MSIEVETNKKSSAFKIITNTLQLLHWTTQGVRVYALVGKSGSGKSYKAKIVAKKFDISAIVDDGIIVDNNKIITGKSAKSELNFLQAVRVSLFDDLEQRQSAIEALKIINFTKILILGTSDRMVSCIAEHLNLPEIYKIIRIEEISTLQEIAAAHKSRSAGNHVIPVPITEIAHSCPHILYDRIKVFLIHRGFLKKKIKDFVEKTIVRPVFQKNYNIFLLEKKIELVKKYLQEITQKFKPPCEISHIKIHLDNDNRIIIRCNLKSLSPSVKNITKSFKTFAIDHLQKNPRIDCKGFNICLRHKNI